MSTNPFDMDDLLGAYALDAVDDEERRAVEEYLATSPRARAEVQQHREVATMLAWSGMDAPEGLWDRIAGSLEGEEAAPESRLGSVLPMRSSRRRPQLRSVAQWALGTAAAALIAVAAVRISSDDTSDTTAAGISSVISDLMADPHSTQAELTSVNQEDWKVRAVVGADGTGFLLADSLPDLPDDRTYQLWGQIEGQPDLISLGLLGPDPHTATFSATGKITLLAITDETRGGVVSSSNPVVVAGVPA